MPSKLRSSVGHAQTVVLVNGPWHEQPFTFRPRDRAKVDHTLPIRVGEHVGRYNLNTGHWVPSEQQA